MTDRSREIVFQLAGAVLALAVAFAGIFGGEALFGRFGKYALFLSVPAGVVIGFLLVKLLQFTYQLVFEDR